MRKRSDSNSTDVGHEGVITGCDDFSLRSSIANPQGVAQSPLQSTTFTLSVSSVTNVYCSKAKRHHKVEEEM
ncbi:hypothetical protein [Lysinibacillus sp. NPDC093688]|uniref:hypothetical protein n=1 Tax=Lysinibacillus sp. NPDC093688 TaxID=3390577 RepID=UPI003D03C429